MNKVKESAFFVYETTSNLIGLKAHNIQLGHGSFITIDFGKQIEVKIKTNQGESSYTRGEWHLWIYMCSWRIDKQGEPFIGCNDGRENVEEKIQELSNQKLLNFEIINSSLDVRFCFENQYILHVFNCYTEAREHWMLFTPDQNVLTLGPSNTFSYSSSSSP